MELRLIDRSFGNELSYPFPNDCIREKGTGFLANNGRDGYTVMHRMDAKKEKLAIICDKIFSHPEVGKRVTYLQVFKKGYSESFTWSKEDYNAYIVNDNGKTIDKI